MFQSTKLPLTVWFQAMHLLIQGNPSLSALELKRPLWVHYETAWAIKHILMQVTRLLHAAIGTPAMPQPLLNLAWMRQAV